MTNNHVLEIQFKNRKEFFREVSGAIAKRKPLIQPKHQIFFESVATFRNFMTIQKIEVLTTIATQKPSSIYELAKLVDRDFAAVLRDCTGLEGTGFITLRATKNAKRTKVPRLIFDYFVMAIELPHSPYQIEFKHAA